MDTARGTTVPAGNFASIGDVPAAPAQHVFFEHAWAGVLARVTKAIHAGSDGSILLCAVGDAAEVVHHAQAGELIIAYINPVTAASPAMTTLGYA